MLFLLREAAKKGLATKKKYRFGALKNNSKKFVLPLSSRGVGGGKATKKMQFFCGLLKVLGKILRLLDTAPFSNFQLYILSPRRTNLKVSKHSNAEGVTV